MVNKIEKLESFDDFGNIKDISEEKDGNEGEVQIFKIGKPGGMYSIEAYVSDYGEVTLYQNEGSQEIKIDTKNAKELIRILQKVK